MIKFPTKRKRERGEREEQGGGRGVRVGGLERRGKENEECYGWSYKYPLHMLSSL